MKLNKAASSLPRRASEAEKYDFIVCGVGYAGAIMTARLAERNPGKKVRIFIFHFTFVIPIPLPLIHIKILAIEYGGHVQSKTGGSTMATSDIDWQASMFQNEGMKKTGDSKYDPKSPLTMPDVPGNYNNVAFRPLARDGYQIPEFKACFQGCGLGGNGVYNGALYQEPANWWWDDNSTHTDIFVTKEQQDQGVKASDIVKPYFDRVQEELKGAIRTTPSMDGVHYNHGLYDLVKPYLNKAGFDEVLYSDKPEEQAVNGKLEIAGDRFYTVPTVNAKDGLRTGASAWLEKFLDEDGNVRPEFGNLTLQTHTEVLKVNLGVDNEVTGVDVSENPEASKQGGRTKTPNPVKKTYSVNKGGKVILSCNALPTNRILYKSGVGPEGNIFVFRLHLQSPESFSHFLFLQCVYRM